MKKLTLFLLLLLLTANTSLLAQKLTLQLVFESENKRDTDKVDITISVQEMMFAMRVSEQNDIRQFILNLPERNLIEKFIIDGEPSANQYEVELQALASFYERQEPASLPDFNITETGNTRKILGFKCREFIVDNSITIWITKDKKLPTHHIIYFLNIAMNNGKHKEFPPEISRIADLGFPLLIESKDMNGKTKRMKVTHFQRKTDEKLFDTTGIDILIKKTNKFHEEIDEEIYMLLEEMEQSLHTPDQMPDFTELEKYLEENVVYPLELKSEAIAETVEVWFVLDIDGSISNVHVRESKHPLLDAEAIRVVSSMPNWIPATINGEPTKLQMMVKVRFEP